MQICKCCNEIPLYEKMFDDYMNKHILNIKQLKYEYSKHNNWRDKSSVERQKKTAETKDALEKELINIKKNFYLL